MFSIIFGGHRTSFSKVTDSLIFFFIDLALCLSCPFGSAFLQLYSLDCVQMQEEVS